MQEIRFILVGGLLSVRFCRTELKTIQMNWENLDSLRCDIQTLNGYNTSGVTLKVPKGTKGMYHQFFNVKLRCKFTIIEN